MSRRAIWVNPETGYPKEVKVVGETDRYYSIAWDKHTGFGMEIQQITDVVLKDQVHFLTDVQWGYRDTILDKDLYAETTGYTIEVEVVNM